WCMGRTSATVGVRGEEKSGAGFGPLFEPVRLMPYGDESAARGAIGERTCAVIVEPLQGEGGVVVPPSAFLRLLRERCDATSSVLILDEVQTGIGWTGHLRGYWQSG